MPDRARANYYSPAGGTRSTSAEHPALADAETSLQLKLLLMVGTIKSESSTTAGDNADYPMGFSSGSYQDAVFVFENATTGERFTIDVRDMSTTFKNAGVNVNTINVSTGAPKNFVDDVIANNAGYLCTSAFYTRH